MATHDIGILGWNAKPDTSGNVFVEPYSIKATNDVWEHLVVVFNDTSTRLYVSGCFRVPQNYVGTGKVVIEWTTTATSGDVEWDFDYRAVGGDDAESLDQAGTQESVNLNDTAPSAANEKMTCVIDLTSANLAANDLVEFKLCRDGTDGGDTIAAAVLVFDAFFRYNDA